ncbi:glucose-1-phosphate cytidylyltransferase [Methylophilaceae bacterium]|nr:glucose-1-phosphate cytidylyltransferase [Methylophilaceae bacterium]|tara:strand:- start:14944 stop:15723 length:780 start_codon:yes stop_codon:yes gene_type:complete
MKAVILAGGLGTRISEETILKPKPMIEIGGLPIIWHLMKIYSHYGINDFIICCGYKGYMIKEYFSNYYLQTSDVTFDLSANQSAYHKSKTEPWKVTLVDTGNQTGTGGRIAKIKEYLDKDEAFCMTYGDGLSDVNINELVEYHKKHKRLATVTATIPPGRFGALSIDDDSSVIEFIEKPKGDNVYINGGFFVLSKKVIDLIKDDKVFFEKEPLDNLAKSNQLIAFQHNGFWQPMDTLREKNYLEELWLSGKAPWKVWNG